MKNWKTTVVGIGEAVMLQLSAEALFDLTWKQRGFVITLAVLRATFSYLAKDKDVTGAA